MRKNQLPKFIKKSHKTKKERTELEGTVSMTREGYAFITVQGMEADIFIPAHKLRGALNGDKVKIIAKDKGGVKPNGRPRRIDGEVVYIAERSKKPYIGILQVSRGEAWVIVESRVMPYDVKLIRSELDKWYGENKWTPAEVSGTKVAVLVTDWPKHAGAPVGKLIDVLGVPGHNDTEMHAILAEFGLPYRFEDSVEKAADKISDKITEKDIEGRRDFRKVTTFTIDPTDAKDFDDALSYRRLDDGNIEVGVHIADVTYYVKPNSIVDKCAYERGTSVYLVDRTVPMLPEMLSNKLCSLRPNEEKLCFSAVFVMNDKAEVLDKWFGRTIINSDYRFDYDKAQEIIETGKGPLSQEIHELYRLAEILKKNRFAHGSISFERPEMKVEVDAEGKPLNVYEKISKEANWLIEEYMLLANKCVAEYVGKVEKGAHPKTFVYRIHEDPNPEKIESLRKFAKLFGYNMPDQHSEKISTSLNTLLGKVKGSPQEGAIEMLALRSMARARYTTDNVGHYGLAFPYYTHFTSPIRRYPDMMVHRLLSMYLDGAPSQNKDY